MEVINMMSVETASFLKKNHIYNEIMKVLQNYQWYK